MHYEVGEELVMVRNDEVESSLCVIVVFSVLSRRCGVLKCTSLVHAR